MCTCGETNERTIKVRKQLSYSARNKLEKEHSSWGTTKDYCEGCQGDHLVYYKQDGAFIKNVCSMCGYYYSESYPWNPYN